jgi:hypothetical protein
MAKIVGQNAHASSCSEGRVHMHANRWRQFVGCDKAARYRPDDIVGIHG